MPRKKRNTVTVTFQRIDARARRARETAKHRSTNLNVSAVVEERTVESLWYDVKPEGWTFLDWHRAWNNGYPTEEHVELYNSLHTEDEHIQLEDEDEDA